METKQTFAYKVKTNFSDFYPGAAFAAVALLCWFFQYGIRFKSLRLLSYPNSVYVFGGLALICLIWAVVKFGKTAKSKNTPLSITVEASSFSFPYKDGMTEVFFSDIIGLDRLDDDDNTFRVSAQGKDYTFEEAYFENKEKYTKFVELVEKLRQKSL